MSCLMSSPELLATLAQALETTLNYSYDFLGYSAPEKTIRSFSDCADRYWTYDARKVFKKLYWLNAKAYATRYREPEESTVPEMPEVKPLSLRAGYQDRHFTLAVDLWKFIKILDFYNYQVQEDATAHDETAEGLRDLFDAISRAIVRNSGEYNAHEWGEI